MKNKSYTLSKILTVLLTAVVALSAGLLVGCQNGKSGNAEFTVTFDYNYAEGPANKVITVKEGQKVAKPSNPERSGYTFEGWYLEANPYDFDSAVKSDLELLARWTTVPAETTPSYSVRFIESDGVKYEFGGVKPTTAEKDSTVSFKVNISPFYTGTPIVKANDDVIVADGRGVYSFEVTRATSITVSGIEEDNSHVLGGGTKSNPYKISTPKQWLEFAEVLNSTANGPALTAYYELTDDIDFRGYTIPAVSYFGGSLNGNGFALKNYVIDFRETIDGEPEVYSFAGLFEYIAGAEIFDIGFIDFYVSVTSNGVVRAGGVAGAIVASTVSNVTAKGEIRCDNTYGYYWDVGGMFGIAASSSGYMNVVESSTIDVKIDCEIGRVGGLAGVTSGASGAPVIIANSAANVNLYTGVIAGGLVGKLGAYSSVTNCYTTGTVVSETTYVRDTVAGGIVGEIDVMEAVVAYSFTSANISSENGYGFSLGGYVYGNMVRDVYTAVPSYGSFSLVYECYYVRSNTFVGCGDVGEHKVYRDVEGDKLFEVMSWNNDNWVFGESRYPTPVLDSAIRLTFTMLFKGEALTISGFMMEDKFEAALPYYAPLCSIFGADAKSKAFISAKSSSVLSCGFYLDEEHTVELPEAYLITDDPGHSTVYLAFADYSKAAGIYYIPLVGGGEITLMLGTSKGVNAARMFSGAGVYDMGFIYYGDINDGLICFIGMPEFFLGGYAMAVDVSKFIPELGVEGLYLTNGQYAVIAYADTKFVGEWYSASAEVPYDFYFNYDLTGTYTDESGNEYEFTYEYAGDRVVVYAGDDVYTFTYKEDEDGVGEFHDVESDTLALSKYDRYYGDYETDLYVGRTVSFDGKRTDYTIGDSGAVKDGATYEVNEDGFLETKDNGTTLLFGKAGSMTGLWSDVEEDYLLYLDGVGIYGFGYAVDNGGNQFTYAILGDPSSGEYELEFAYYGEVVSVATVTKNVQVTESTITLTLPLEKGKTTFHLRLDDSFRGTWYTKESETDTITLGFRKAKVGEGEEVTYTYTDFGNAVTFNYGGSVYKVTYVAQNQMSVTINGGSAAIYKQYDEFYGLSIMPDDGSEIYEFNGFGETGNGKVTYTYTERDEKTGGYKAVEKTLDYTVDSQGRAVITENGDAFATVTPREDGLYDFSKGERSSVFGIVNPFTGSWSIFASELKIDVGPLSTKLTAKGEMHIGGETLETTYEYDPTYGYLYVYAPGDDGETVDLYFLMSYNSKDGMLLYYSTGSGLDSMPMARTDILSGYWETEDGYTLWFDGTGIDSKMGYGLVVLYPDYESNPDDYEVLYYGYDKGSYVLMMEVGEYLIMYAEIPVAPMSDINWLLGAADLYEYFELCYSKDGELAMAICYFYPDDLTGLSYEGDSGKYEFVSSLYYDLKYNLVYTQDTDLGVAVGTGYYLKVYGDDGELEAIYRYEETSYEEVGDSVVFTVSVYELGSNSVAFTLKVTVDIDSWTVTGVVRA